MILQKDESVSNIWYFLLLKRNEMLLITCLSTHTMVISQKTTSFHRGRDALVKKREADTQYSDMDLIVQN